MAVPTPPNVARAQVGKDRTQVSNLHAFAQTEDCLCPRLWIPLAAFRATIPRTLLIIKRPALSALRAPSLTCWILLSRGLSAARRARKVSSLPAPTSVANPAPPAVLQTAQRASIVHWDNMIQTATPALHVRVVARDVNQQHAAQNVTHVRQANIPIHQQASSVPRALTKPTPIKVAAQVAPRASRALTGFSNAAGTARGSVWKTCSLPLQLLILWHGGGSPLWQRSRTPLCAGA